MNVKWEAIHEYGASIVLVAVSLSLEMTVDDMVATDPQLTIYQT